MKKAYSVAIIFSMVSLLSVSAFAANGTWYNNGPTSPDWGDTNNWSINTIPGATTGTTSTDIAVFNTSLGGNNYGGSTTPITVDSGRNIEGINFDTAAGNYFIGNSSLNPLLLSSGGSIQILNTLTATNAIETINAPLVIEGASGTYTFSNNSANGTGAGAGTLNIGGGITGSAASATVLTLNGSNTNSNTISGGISNGTAASVAITKSGAGTWVLSGANTYTGATAVNAGTLEAGTVTQAFGVGSAVTVAGGATLDLGGFNETIGSLAGAGTVTSSTGSTPTLTAGSNNSSTAFSGIIQNGSAASVGFTKVGSGTLILTGANTYTGITTISGGTLQVGNNAIAGSLGTGAVTDNANLTFDLTNNPTISNIISGTGAVTQDGTGILTLSGANNYSGGTTVNAGTLTATGTSGLGGTTGALSVNNTNIGAGSDVVLNLSTTAPTTTGSLSGTIAVPSSSTNTDTINNGGQSFTVNQTANGTYAGVIAGTGGFTLGSLSTNTLTLSGNNTYSGGTTLDAGTLDLGSSGAIGSSGTITLGGGTLQYSVNNNTDYSSLFSTAADQAYNIDTNGRDVIFATALTSSGGTLTKIGSGTLTLTGTNTYDGTTTISGGVLQIGNNGVVGSLGTGNVVDNANLTFNLTNNPTILNVISGTGAVTQDGTGTLTLSGVNTYSGGTAVNDGTLEAGMVNQAFGVGSAMTVASGAMLDLGGLNEAIGSLAGAGTVTNSGGSAVILTAGADNTSTAFSGNIQDGAGIGLDKKGTGTLTLSGNNTYSGGTTLDAGTLDLGSSNAIGSSGTITFDGGTLQYSASNTTDYSSRFSVGGNEAYNIDTNGQNVTFATALTSSNGTLTKIGSGTLTLTAANTYGATTVNGGILTVSGVGSLGVTTGTLSVNNTNTGAGDDTVLNLSTTTPTTTGSLSGAIAAPSSGTNTDTINNGGQLFTVNQTVDGTYAGVIAGTGGFMLGNLSSSTLTLSGDNTYSGGTTINAGKLQVGNSGALGTGAVVNNATLILGTTNLSVGGVYTQNTGSNLNLTVNNSSGSLIYGSITSAVAASVASGSFVNVAVGGYIPNGSKLEIINTGGTGVGVGPAPDKITSNSSTVSFSSSISDGNLTLKVINSGFAPFANNANARSLGNALNNIPSPSSDMTTILNTLEVLTTGDGSKITSALNTMGPVVDGGVVQNSSAALNNLVSATLDRVQNTLDHVTSSENFIGTGVSSGDGGELNGIWAKPYGSYLTQDTLQGIQGYNAWNAGTVVGYDQMITDNFTMGVSSGYAYGQVNSDVNNANTNIRSAQGTLYGGYQNPDLNYYIDAAGSFAWNWYDGQRDISVDSINRTADANYDGQQYGAYLGGGYKFNFGGDLDFTPIASLQWTHLSIDSYTETNANALDLNVNSQSYDTLESGLGLSISYPEQLIWGNFTPELHAKWLYDFIDDSMVVTSSFTGGGGSFTSNGAAPSKQGADIGGKLSFDLNNNFSIIAEADTELKEGFFGVYGSGTVRYKF